MTSSEAVPVVWMGRHKAAEYLGVTTLAMSIFTRDKVLRPDCMSCGRIRWKVEDLRKRREELRHYLRTQYADQLKDLIVRE